MARCKNTKLAEYPDETYQRLLKSYQGNMLTQAKVIDETSFSKHGITHVIGLVIRFIFRYKIEILILPRVEGGNPTEPLQPPKKRSLIFQKDNIRHFHFLCRSQGMQRFFLAFRFALILKDFLNTIQFSNARFQSSVSLGILSRNMNARNASKLPGIVSSPQSSKMCVIFKLNCFEGL